MKAGIFTTKGILIYTIEGKIDKFLWMNLKEVAGKNP